MKIILANPRGFCAGVNMAIECLERALEFFGPPLYVYHEIVHNKFVVERFRKRGTVFVESLSEVPEGSPLLYSAHGVSPQIRSEARRRQLLAIDATCPLVIKVHLEAIRYAKEGYTIVLIGHEGHDEVIGTMGEAPNQMLLVETAEDVERLEVPDPEKVAYLTQTTLSVDDANVVIAALRKKFPHIANPPKDDICYATQNRQEAVRELAAQADLVLVLGSQNSSNSRRLAEIANSLGIPSYLIDGVSEIRHDWFEGIDTVLITAGASAPEQVVQECIEYLERHFGAVIQEQMVREENVRFPLPRSLRELLNAGATVPVSPPETDAIEIACTIDQMD
ncbi:MAG: 4-hydroxy-3-methylbut-2-enyl diphosphate reductase [Isosphaeraceae bacterium]